jgi:hypothetical protein
MRERRNAVDAADHVIEFGAVTVHRKQSASGDFELLHPSIRDCDAAGEIGKRYACRKAPIGIHGSAVQRQSQPA